MARIRKVDRWGERGNKRKVALGGSNGQRVDWLPRSLHCAAANYAAAPVGMTELGLMSGGRVEWRVSEWDTGMKMMQEWKLGAEGKASVCNGIWKRGIGKRPANKGE
jgi:hypothetical protein